MSGLVGESQTAFVKGRRIHDGVLIACETIQWLKLKKRATTIIKLDFQKAYDIIKWNFVDMVLEKMGFGTRWRAWTAECIRTASISIMVNGEPSKPFKMERGLRQGDPLSPFLFVLVVDVLNMMIGEAVKKGE
ncbi:secreted RxLR effector protein 78-like [Arachis duranensis]|uniref:Secreted RxLR effector protein 78-like n=1 Tax=Arachis duranensis TaxID=130453 RepID=A0A9C6WF47_ARADU|nr:secreted RxLR effector protein 78-like [Arachis duranensis]